jgi:DNA-binding NarL/FixJ family response regulator
MTIKILLVDDSQAFLTAVRRFIHSMNGVEVVGQAHDGLEALAMAAKLMPDLMLLDISMPELNGLEVAKQMQAWPQSPRIVFLSMHDNTGYRAAAQEVGAVGFLYKPNVTAELTLFIERLVADDCQKSGHGLTAKL